MEGGREGRREGKNERGKISANLSRKQCRPINIGVHVTDRSTTTGKRRYHEIAYIIMITGRDLFPVGCISVLLFSCCVKSIECEGNHFA